MVVYKIVDVHLGYQKKKKKKKKEIAIWKGEEIADFGVHLLSITSKDRVMYTIMSECLTR